MEKQRLSILGSTGSIGVQTLDIVRENPDRFEVVSLTAHKNSALLEKQIREANLDDTIYNEIVKNMKLQNPNRPVILVADTFNRVVFMSQGYSIGLGEQLVKVLKKLQ